ncbi:MAG: hypothetical protein IIA45_03155, partial [Bacteroidetes bacterium]|nr:hypothetical protein [Bacteroidota bacterium]
MVNKSLLQKLLLLLLLGLITGLNSKLSAQNSNPYAHNAFQYVFIDGGGTHTVALKCDGTVWTWGDNSSGQLGDGTAIDKNVPTQVTDPADATGFLQNVIAVSAGGSHTMALKADSTVVVWGDDTEAQMGDGVVGPDETTPKTVAGITTAIAISAGGAYCTVLLADGTLRAWGNNADLQLGNNDATNPILLPDTVEGLDTTVVQVSAGTRHTLALQIDGTVMACGRDDRGQIGDGPPAPDAPQMVNVDSLSPGDGNFAVVIAAGLQHSFAVLNTGEVFGWGENSSDEITSSCGSPQRRACKIGGITTAV